MNKLDYPENLGKIFLRNLELTFLKEGLDEAFQGLLAAFSGADSPNNGIKLSGCEVEISGTTYDVSAGFIYLLGEVFRVDAHQLEVAGGETAYFDIEETDFDSAWPAPIENSTTHQTRKNRVVKLVKSSSPPNERMNYNAPYLEKKLMDAAHPAGHPIFFDPRLEGKAMTDYFNMVTGEGVPNKRYDGWIVLGVYVGTEMYKNRAIVNLNASDTDFNDLGKLIGEKRVTLTVPELPSHGHLYTRSDYNVNVNTGTEVLVSSVTSTQATQNQGDGQSHNNMQPSIVAALICRKHPDAFYMP